MKHYFNRAHKAVGAWECRSDLHPTWCFCEWLLINSLPCLRQLFLRVAVVTSHCPEHWKDRGVLGEELFCVRVPQSIENCPLRILPCHGRLGYKWPRVACPVHAFVWSMCRPVFPEFELILVKKICSKAEGRKQWKISFKELFHEVQVM